MARLLSIALLITSCIWLLSPPALAQEQEFILIGHPDIPVTHLSPKTLNRIFTKQLTHWSDGTPVVPVELSRGAAREAFFDHVIGVSANAAKTYWINQLMTNGQRPPKSFSMSILVINFIYQTPGAIGFVAADTETGERVRRISVD